jgi:uncharacterized protein YqgC (DUF456 family)
VVDVLAVLLLGGACVAGLILVPLGLPGLWLMVLGVIGYGALTGFRSAGPVTIGVVIACAAVGEVLEAWFGFRYAKRYGGSSRSAWGALLGGLVGAGMGVPVPVIGSVIGAFVGSFVGAALFEYSLTWRAGTALGAGWGAVWGRAAAAAIKVGLGVVIAVIGVVAVVRG